MDDRPDWGAVSGGSHAVLGLCGLLTFFFCVEWDHKQIQRTMRPGRGYFHDFFFC